MPAGRPRSKLRYLVDPFYVAMAQDRGMSPALILRRSERRLQAFEKLRRRQVKARSYYRAIWGADNPFIESHAWKYLMRSALEETRLQRRNHAESKNTTTEP